MLSPDTVRWCKVVNLGEVLELIHRSLTWRDPKLVFQFPGCRHTHTELLSLDFLLLKVIEGVRAACVRPHVREGDLLCGALLEQQLAIAWSEDESGECAVEETLVDILHEMACGESYTACVRLTVSTTYMSFCRLLLAHCPVRPPRYTAHP